MEHDWTRHLAGRFLVFDGPDGSGKSTQIKRFGALCRENRVELVEVREPGGTAVGEQIRSILLDPGNADCISLKTEMLLYMASRAQLVEERIRPALREGALVVADRFVSSTLAYQGTAGGLDISEILAVSAVALGDCRPDLVVIFDVDEETAAGRLNPLLDRIEQRGREYHRRVREGYRVQAARDPDRHLVIDASCDPDRVFVDLLQGLRTRFSAET